MKKSAPFRSVRDFKRQKMDSFSMLCNLLSMMSARDLP